MSELDELRQQQKQQKLDHSDEDSNNSHDESDNEEEEAETTLLEDPLTRAIDELEERCVSVLDSFKLHSGMKSSHHTNIHDELKELLRPVLEIASHMGPHIARTHSMYRVGQVDESVEEVYSRLNASMILPVLLEVAQSDTIPAKRAAALVFFHALYKECQQAGSYLDKSTTGPNAGPTGPGVSNAQQQKEAAQMNPNHPSFKSLAKRRLLRKEAREGELLRYWIEASIGCLVLGSFSSETSDGAVASRGVLAASAAVRPALRYMAAKIKAADDAAATRLYVPTMRMMEGVLKRLFLSTHTSNNTNNGSSNNSALATTQDALISTCIKFLETVVLCFSSKTQPEMSPALASLRHRSQRHNANDPFSLEDLPTGHPIITREALEEIGEMAFTTLRGLTLMGGQVKMDADLLEYNIFNTLGQEGNELGLPSTASAQIINIIKPAALAFLEVEANVLSQINTLLDQKQKEEDNDDEEMEDKDKDEKNKEKAKDPRMEIELSFTLSQKSYAVTINALSATATNRPPFFHPAATTLAQRAMYPPTKEASLTQYNLYNHPLLSDTALKALSSHLKSSCLTLLRNPFSITMGGSDILGQALSMHHMEIQAKKASAMARQQAALKTAGRAARNRAALYYEWDKSVASDTTMTAEEFLQKSIQGRKDKRQRDTDDALAKMRAAKLARGLGRGIALPKSMVDCCELILLNLSHLPDSRPRDLGKKKKFPMTFDYLVDAVMSNGASLRSEESRWYDRDGGNAWSMEIPTSNRDDLMETGATLPTIQFQLDSKTISLATASVGGAAKKASDTGGGSNNSQEEKNLFHEQCKTSASDAFGRIVVNASKARSRAVSDFGQQIAARLAWTLKGVKPPGELKEAYKMVTESAKSANLSFSTDKLTKEEDKEKKEDTITPFVEEYPLVSSCLALNFVPTNAGSFTGGSNGTNKNDSGGASSSTSVSQSLANRVLNEAFLVHKANASSSTDDDNKKENKYEKSVDVFVSTVAHACKQAENKPNDLDRKRIATQAASSLHQQLSILPSITPASLQFTSTLCDIEPFHKRAAEASRKNSQHSLSASAAAHAAKDAAEKRATAALRTLRDAAYQWSQGDVRKSAVDCAVGIAAGRIPSSTDIEETALKLIVNKMLLKSKNLADTVMTSATQELEMAATYAISQYDKVQEANKERALHEQVTSNPLVPQSDEEKMVMDKVRKPALLFMALCVRQSDMIKTLMNVSSREKADVLSKAVRSNMPIFAKAASKKYGK